jgi:hypothetical protein
LEPFGWRILNEAEKSFRQEQAAAASARPPNDTQRQKKTRDQGAIG